MSVRHTLTWHSRAQLTIYSQPPYFFRIDEIAEHHTAPVVVTSQGHWVPSTVAGANRRMSDGVSGVWWFCNRQQLHQIPNGQLPAGASYHSAFSMYYCAGYGFWVLKGDVTAATNNMVEAWRPLRFEHDGQDYSSYLTNAGQSHTLRCQRPDQHWPQMLLPDIYQTHPMPTHQSYGALKGDLGIFLALIAFSMSKEDLQQYLRSMFLSSRWQVHGLAHGRVNQRGVVVNIYTCPTDWAGGSTSEDLNRYQNGEYNPYYN
ncbi:hypothetical protein K458DRAFT_301218 [Lentithecium fluviatile CBS 122367]|uniref:Uncharacterized protein n=1 Tax=Lentithecium fluviatile CBS 122367 TaxID=1168545 RepID=A0A6G1J4D0_9PLEO|nr:hypothetical protein K458DRAFT_301218 [Lentithecium fluviatile CBS 122367]